MWLQARTRPDLDTEIAVSDFIDVMLNHAKEELNFRICFGGIELGIDDEGLFNQFSEWKELVEAGIEELSIEFEVPYPHDTEEPGEFTLMLYPDETTLLSAYTEEKSWHHLKIKEWKLVPHQS